MSFPRYPEYKDSGVDWLGEVPTGWCLWPVKRGFVRKKELNIGMQCENRLALTMRGVVPRDLDDLDGLQASEFETYQLFQENDLAFKLIDLQNIKTSRVGLVPEGGIMSPAYIRLTPSLEKINPKFAYWFFTDLYNRNIFNQLGGGVRQTLGPEELTALPFPFFCIVDQMAIASFLDHETAKIDALVAEQEKLIALLKEKRQAVISHVVTKGLNPDVPMKDSGIEWLGKVPAHWAVAPVGYRYSVQLGKMLDTARISGRFLRPYLRVFDVQWGGINVDELPLMDFDEDARAKFRLEPGDLLVNEGGSYPGRAAIWIGDLDECYYQKALHRLRPRNADDTTAYLYYVMCWAADHGVFTAGGNEATIEHLPAEKLRRYRFPFPPIAEQIAIAEFLNRRTLIFDELSREAERAIELFKERRSALISAAVTGKIDVRSLVAERNAA